MGRRCRALLFRLICLAGPCGTAPAFAAYPDHPVRWLIGFTAGAPVDIVARTMAQRLSDRFGQQFVVENRAGSGGNLAAAAAVNAAPDGDTLLFVASQRDQRPAVQETALRLHPRHRCGRKHHAAHQHDGGHQRAAGQDGAGVHRYCRANPGKISFAWSGNGTSVHMSVELFKAMTKCDMLHVPYRGSTLAFPDITSNKVQLIFDHLPTALEQSRGGNVHALGVTSPQRWPGVPDVPAIAETVPGFDAVGFYGISAPKGTRPRS
jgi:tripartite-type tricarboxylate transporter receptor subunit TctC